MERDDYAEMIVAEIPYDELVDAAISVLKERSRGDGAKLQFFYRALLNRDSGDSLPVSLSSIPLLYALISL